MKNALFVFFVVLGFSAMGQSSIFKKEKEWIHEVGYETQWVDSETLLAINQGIHYTPRFVLPFVNAGAISLESPVSLGFYQGSSTGVSTQWGLTTSLHMGLGSTLSDAALLGAFVGGGVHSFQGHTIVSGTGYTMTGVAGSEAHVGVRFYYQFQPFSLSVHYVAPWQWAGGSKGAMISLRMLYGNY